MTIHTIVAIVEDHPGVLNRISSILRRLSVNIESVTSGPTGVPSLIRVTIVVSGPALAVDQARKQLAKMIEVVKVSDISGEDMMARELALIKVKTTRQNRSEIMQVVEVTKAGIVDVSPDSITVEVTGDTNRVNSIITLLQAFDIREIARTGRVAITRGTAGVLQLEEAAPVKKPKRSQRAPAEK